MGLGSGRVPWAAVALATILSGCAGGGQPAPPQTPPPPTPDFSLGAFPTTVGVSQGSAAPPISVSVQALNGFAGSVQVSIQGLPSGVASNPASPFSIAAGDSQQLVLSAASSAAAGTSNITLQAASAALFHSASVELTVTAPVPVLPRTTYARTDAVPASDDPPGEPRRRRIVYDPTHKRVFVANRAMNHIEVFSSSTLSLVGEVSVPAATSVDLSADGSTLWVGSEVEQIVAVDPQALTVKARFPVAGFLIANELYSLPTEVAALANGKLLVRLRRTDAPMSMLTLWDPATNAFTNLTNRAPTLFASGAGVMARSGDHSLVMVAANDASGSVAVFDLSGTVVAQWQASAGGAIPLLAASPSGAFFAAFVQAGQDSQVFLLRLSGNALNSINAYGLSALHGLAFSRDGARLYLSEAVDAPPVITVLNGQQLTPVAQTSDLLVNGLRSEVEDADETGLLFGVINRGLGFIDAASAGTLSGAPAVLAAAPSAIPSEGPPAGGTTTMLSGQGFSSGAVVAFGAQLASAAQVSGPAQIQVTSPPSQASVPVNIAAYFPGGWLAVAPDGFSYGPQILEVSPSAVSGEGGDQVQILGYGFGSDASKVSVIVGGNAATVLQAENLPGLASSLALDSSYPFPLERLTIQTPPGAPGKATLQVTAPAGTSMASGALQYLQSVQVFQQHPVGGYAFLTYDQFRNRVYLSTRDHVDVFDVSGAQFLPALTPPGGAPPGAVLRGMALTPDGLQLVVADFGAANVYLLAPDSPGTGTTMYVGGVPGFQNSGPARVAATNTGKIFVGTGESTDTCSPCLGQLDLTTQQAEVAPQADLSLQTGGPVVLDGAPLLEGTAQGDQVFVVSGASPGGPVTAWSAATNQFVSTVGYATGADLSVAADGTNLVTLSSLDSGAAPQLWDPGLHLALRASVSEKQNIPGLTYVPGLTLHPSGSLLYRPFFTGAPGMPTTRAGVDVFHARTGALKLRVFLPELFLTAADALHGDFLATDEWGQSLFALTQSGLTVVQLASVPLAVGWVSPANGPAAGGTVLTIRGSGFQSGSAVTVGGAAAKQVTFVDADTLQVTTPPLATGPQQIVVTNPDGESDALDAAFTAN